MIAFYLLFFNLKNTQTKEINIKKWQLDIHNYNNNRENGGKEANNINDVEKKRIYIYI